MDIKCQGQCQALSGAQSAPVIFLLIETHLSLPRVLPSRASPLQSARLILLKQNSLTVMLQALNASHWMSEASPHGKPRFRPSDPTLTASAISFLASLSCVLCAGATRGAYPSPRMLSAFLVSAHPAEKVPSPPVCPGSTPPTPPSTLLPNLQKVPPILNRKIGSPFYDT